MFYRVLILIIPLSGAQTVVQPGAQILAEGGPIVIGEGNLIQEQVTIANRSVLIWLRPVSHASVGTYLGIRAIWDPSAKFPPVFPSTVCGNNIFIPSRKLENGEQKTLEIGNGNVFHVGARILLSAIVYC